MLCKVFQNLTGPARHDGGETVERLTRREGRNCGDVWMSDLRFKCHVKSCKINKAISVPAGNKKGCKTEPNWPGPTAQPALRTAVLQERRTDCSRPSLEPARNVALQSPEWSRNQRFSTSSPRFLYHSKLRRKIYASSLLVFVPIAHRVQARVIVSR